MGPISLAGRTTEDWSQFNSFRASDRSLILCRDSSLAIEEFTLELAVGRAWAHNYSPVIQQLHEIPEEGVRLLGKGSIVVEADALLAIPDNLYGLVIPTGRLFLERGILIAAAKIEPGFQGRLKLRLVSTTSSTYMLRPNDKIASALFFSTDSTMVHAPITRESHIVPRKKGFIRLALRWLHNNPTVWINWLVSLLVGPVAALLIAFYVLRIYR